MKFVKDAEQLAKQNSTILDSNSCEASVKAARRAANRTCPAKKAGRSVDAGHVAGLRKARAFWWLNFQLKGFGYRFFTDFDLASFW